MTIALIVLIILLIFILFASYTALAVAVIRTKKPLKIGQGLGAFADIDTIYKDELEKGLKSINDTPMKEIILRSHDGLKLYGRFFKNGDSKRTIIMMHGYRSNGSHDFCCAFKLYFDKGLNILIPDQRAHGKSEGRYITYGVKERFDVLKWIEFVNKEVPDGEIFLSGISMGATTVLMAAGCELPDNVKGISADCGFTSPEAIIKKVMKEDMKLPYFPLYYTTNALSKIFAGFSFSEYSAAEAVKSCKVPILFIHGRADGFVPFSMGEENYNAASCDKHSVWVEGADHGCSFLIDPDSCVNAVTSFLKI